MTKIYLALVLFFFLNFAQANELPYGLWQFPGNEVWVEILENGSTFQCRIAQDKSVITAHGKLVNFNTINWGNLSIKGMSGNAIEVPPGIAWGTDKIILSDGKLSLSGPYGTFIYEKCCSAIPKSCQK